MKKNNLQSLFNPQSIAIVGASNKKGKVGTVIAENISKLGYKGRIYYVNPSYKILKLKRCYESVSAINKKIDLIVISVPAKFVLDVVKDSMNLSRNFVIISAGFSETGEDGAQREKQLHDLAKKHGLNILGPNCLGFIVPKNKLNASFAGGMPAAGNIAFASQSGALAVALMDKAKGEQIGFSHVISIGNQMQLDESELLEYLAGDRETKVIGMYLEGIKNGEKFLEIAKRVSKIKPIVILKAGKTEKAQLAISSHTGALAGSDEIVDVAFEKSGVIRADDLEEFFDLLTLISFTDAPKNNKVAVVTNAGGAGVLTTDAFKGRKITLAEISTKIKNQIKMKLPSEASVENPIDLLGDADEARYSDALKALGLTAGTIISVLTPQQQTPVEKIANVIIENKAKNVTTAAIFIGGDRVFSSINLLKKSDVPNFSDPQRAITALDKYYRWEVVRKQKEIAVKSFKSAGRKKNVAEIVAKAKKENRSALLFAEAAEIAKQYGIDSGDFWTIAKGGTNLPAGGSEISKFPLVAKIDSDTVLHKSDRQGVILSIKNQAELSDAIAKLQQNFPGEQILIQPMQSKQIELILGIKVDEIFGPVIVYGLGGIYTEVFKMVNFMLAPMSLVEIKNHILESKIGFLFQGVRGQAVYDLEEFASILQGLMALATENRQLAGLDINPLFIYNDGRKASAVDIKIII
ncbi:MAG: hypothetical protein ACD_56C00090G0005 [uncultured bacterium]|nr:MAG: hypothetical protein ACD_56C00090G0005 [uncultured bacterium]